MIFGAAAIMTAQRLEFWQAVGFAALVSVILMLGAFAAFAFGNLLLNPLPPAIALFIGAFSIAGGKSIGGVLRDDNLRGSFHDTLPEPAMKSAAMAPLAAASASTAWRAEMELTIARAMEDLLCLFRLRVFACRP